MEPYSQSHSHFNGHIKPPNAPINGNNAGGYVATSYDDVFGGPPKYATLAPRADDYSEIFGAFCSSAACNSRASSIPVLDLPDVADIGAGGGVLFDYSDVFGGFDDVGFAVSFDQLFGPVDADHCCSSSSDDDEAWTPVGPESLSDDSDPFAISEKSRCFLNKNLHPPVDKQFSVSYNKVNFGTNTCISNMTHVAQLNAVPGFTCVVDETTSLRETGAKECNPAEVDDIIFNVNSSSILSEKHKIKNIYEMSLDAGLKSFDGDHVHLRAYVASTSHVSSALESVSDINHIAKSSDLPPLSRLPPEAAKRKGEISSTSGLKSSDDCSSETLDNKLPPCFDMEVDASSFATASAAAMKDAMKKAQAKLKAASVLMDRKKGGLEGVADVGLTADGDGGNNVQTSLNEFVYGDNRLETESGKCAATLLGLPDKPTGQQPNFVAVKPAERKHEKCNFSMNSVFIEGDGEWKEVTQYYEFVTVDSNRVVPQPPRNVDGKISSMKQLDDGHNSDSAEDVIVPERNRPRLKTIKSVSRQAYYDKMSKVVQEVHDSAIGGHMNRDHELTSSPQGNHKVQKRKSGYASEKNTRKIGHMQRVEKNSSSNDVKIKSKNDLGDEEIKKKEGKKKGSKACHQEESDQKTYGPHRGRVKEFAETKEGKRRMKELYGRVESDWSAPEVVGGTERLKKAKEAYEEQKIENKLADAVEQKKGKVEREVKEKRSKEPCKNDFDGNGLQTTSGNQAVGQTKDMKRTVEDERPRKTFVDVLGGERLERASDIQENDNKIDVLLRNEGGDFVEVAVCKEGSERILEECVELGKHWKYQDAPEQLIGLERQRQDECQKPASAYKESEEGPNRVNNGKKLEKSMKHGIEDKAIQVDEMDEAVKISKKTGDAGRQNFVCGSPIIIEWQDDDQGSERSSEMELPVENEYLNSFGRTDLRERNVEVQTDTPTAKFRSSRIAADELQNVFALRNGKVSAGSCDKESNLKTVDTAHVLVDEKPTESSAAEMGGFEGKGDRTVRSSDSYDGNENNSKSGELFNRNQDIMKHKHEKIAQSVPDSMLVKDYNIAEGGRRINLGGAHVLCAQNEKVKSTPAKAISGCNEREHAKSKDEVHAAMPVNWKENIEKRLHLPGVSQSTEEKGKISNQNCNFEEKTETKVNDFKEEQLRMLEEERERQREREKDRMAVEIAIREARERAFADARDKAERNAIERAADEARQRMMNEARERLEKACAEARERSLADKASEARSKADRVVVERATAEARQRAIEKAMAERATFEARELMQRSISEKYLPERDVVKRQSSMPSVHSEEFEAAALEPAQRCKARLERHHRTVERVAKALAEKNMRDLLAQKEQTERSRLAETLGADIKRWSNGKEGNLRALLSTLQYILGPDSGWQPIPLTEVITATAVKKAYRKAALCVHPDKLQQRGASIQQKYVCEKVFDLLKEAWNRFNSEEK